MWFFKTGGGIFKPYYFEGAFKSLGLLSAMYSVFVLKSFKFFPKKIGCLWILIFTFQMSLGPFLSPALAQDPLGLPHVGSMIFLSPAFSPPLIKGIRIFPANALHFDFIVDPGNANPQGEDLQQEASRLIKYFLASLTIPEKDLWVNLSPYEKDRIVPGEFGLTEMGRDLLAQDYLLKQITSSLMYPDDELGKKFWERIYRKAYELYGKTDIPVNTFNKIWIVPDKALVYQHGDMAFVADSHLKVMLEEDYKARRETGDRRPEEKPQASKLTTDLVREMLIPEIEKEVNAGKNFTALRQIYYSLILATWFKRNLKESLLGKAYVGKEKIAGVDVNDKTIKEKIYQQYLEAFKVGVYNFIREDYDPMTQQMIPRKYFSGGMGLERTNLVFEQRDADVAMLGQQFPDQETQRWQRVSTNLEPDNAMGDVHLNDVTRKNQDSDKSMLTTPWQQREVKRFIDVEQVQANLDKISATPKPAALQGINKPMIDDYIDAVREFNRFLKEEKLTDPVQQLEKEYRNVHALLLKNLPAAYPGQYAVSGNREKVTAILQSLFSAESEARLRQDPLSTAIQVLADLVYLQPPEQPFVEGNNRASGFILNFILIKLGYAPYLMTVEDDAQLNRIKSASKKRFIEVSQGLLEKFVVRDWLARHKGKLIESYYTFTVKDIVDGLRAEGAIVPDNYEAISRGLKSLAEEGSVDIDMVEQEGVPEEEKIWTAFHADLAMLAAQNGLNRRDVLKAAVGASAFLSSLDIPALAFGNEEGIMAPTSSAEFNRMYLQNKVDKILASRSKDYSGVPKVMTVLLNPLREALITALSPEGKTANTEIFVNAWEFTEKAFTEKSDVNLIFELQQILKKANPVDDDRVMPVLRSLKGLTGIHSLNDFDSKKPTLLLIHGAGPGTHSSFKDYLDDPDYNVVFFAYNALEPVDAIATSLTDGWKQFREDHPSMKSFGLLTYSYGETMYRLATRFYDSSGDIFKGVVYGEQAPPLGGSWQVTWMDILPAAKFVLKNMIKSRNLVEALNPYDDERQESLFGEFAIQEFERRNPKRLTIVIDGDQHAPRQRANPGPKLQKFIERYERALGNNDKHIRLSKMTANPHRDLVSDPRAIRLFKDFFKRELQPDKAMTAAIHNPQDVGGIDLNPETLNLQTQGDNINFKVPANVEGLTESSFNGLTPVIFQILPITNLKLLLGAADKEKTSQTEKSRSVSTQEI